MRAAKRFMKSQVWRVQRKPPSIRTTRPFLNLRLWTEHDRSNARKAGPTRRKPEACWMPRNFSKFKQLAIDPPFFKPFRTPFFRKKSCKQLKQLKKEAEATRRTEKRLEEPMKANTEASHKRNSEKRIKILKEFIR